MPKIVKANGKTFTFEDNVTNEQISSTIDEYFNVKKKVATQPTAPKKQLESPTQQQSTPTLSDTEETQPPVESDGLGGPPKMKTFTGFTPEEQQTLQAKPVPKISKSAALIGKKLTLQKELSTTKVTPENQEEVLRKTDELANIIKEQDIISNTRLSEIEEQFKSAKDEEAADIEADKRLNDVLTTTGIWNNVKAASLNIYNKAVEEVSAITDEPGIKEFKADLDPLSDEKKQIRKDAAKNKIELSDVEVEEQAKQLYKNKQKDYIETDNINSFLDNLDEGDKNLLKQRRRNLGEHLQESNIKEEKVINAYEVVGNKKIKEYKIIEQELLKYKNNNQPLPKDMYDTYVSLGNEIVGIGNSIQKRQSVINKNKEDLGTVKQEFDLLKRRYGDIDNAVTNIGLGGTKILNGILGFTNYAAKFAGGAQGQIYSLAGQQVTDKISDYIVDEESQLRKSVESIESPEGLVNYASDILSKQIPNLVAASTGIGGLGVIGISSTGEKYTEMTREVLEGKATYSPLQMAVAPALWGSAEVISEIPTLSILKKGGRVFDSIVKNEGDLIKKSVKEKAKEWAKDWSVDMGKEVTGEEFTNFTQNFTNKYILGKKDVGLLDNAGTVLKDTFTLTNILKAAPHIAGAVLKPHQNNSDLNILDENSKKIIDFSKQLENELLNDTERAVITKQIDKATAQNSKIIANTIEKVNNMPDDVYKKIIDLNNNIADIKIEAVAINDGNLPNKAELIKSLESDYRTAQTERNALIDAKYEAKPEVQSPAEVVTPTEVVTEEENIDKARIKRRLENDNILMAEGSTFYDEVNPIKNGKIGDKVYFKEYKDGVFTEYKTKIKEIVDGKVIFENGKTGDDVSSGINVTAEDAWFAKNYPELSNLQPKAEVPTTEVISPETSSNYANLTENKEGDFVFFHVGGKGYDKINKSTGGTTATSKEEAGALSKVGGVAMYYTKPGDTETMVNGEAKYAVTIPKEKVYDANTDPRNYAEEAKTRHEEENPGKAFDANSKLAYITKIAGENGYDMVVSEWMGKTRAQTTTELTPTDVQLKEGDKIAKPFKEEYVDNTAKGLKSIVPESKEAKLKAVYDEINDIRNKQNKYDALYKLSSKDLTNVPQEETTKLIEESDLPQEVKDKYAEALAYEPGIRRTASIVGKEVEVKNAPEGHHLNIGLLEGRTDKVMSAEDVLSKLPKDIKAISYSEIEGTEPSISVEISRPLTTSEMNKFLEDTKQQAIPQLSNKKGILYDVKRGTAEGWGEFDPKFFVTQDGKNLAETKPTAAKSKLAAFKAKYVDKPVYNRTKLDTQVENAKKSLSKLLPNVKFVVHDTRESFIGVAGKNARGYYDPATKTIHINALEANARTVAHEVFHSVLLDKVKTDANARDLTKRMISAISKTLEGNPDLKKNLDDFVKNYDENIKNEEKVAELFGYLADGYQGFDAPTKSIIKRAMDRLAKMFGLKPFTEEDIVDMLKTLSGKVATGEEIVSNDIKAISEGASSYISEPTNIERFSKTNEENVVVGDHELSFVKESDLIDIDALMKDITAKKQNVWFWVADQLGRGNYFDKVIDGEHYLDAGPSFALDPNNRDKNVIWATGKEEKEITKLIGRSDYIFIISGSPQKSKLFNKKVFNLFEKRIGNYTSFKKEVLDSNPTKPMRDVLNAHNSWETLREDASVDNAKTKTIGTGRKKFLIALLDAMEKPKSKAYNTYQKRNAFVDVNDIRDGFYKDNNFNQNDIMLVLKPTKIGGKSEHSTYENDILGEVVGVPNIKVNAFDIMTPEVKDKYKKVLQITEQQQAVAPYGIGVKQIERFQEIEWEESKIGRGDRAIVDRNENVRNAAEEYSQGKIDYKEYLDIMEANSPIKPITNFIEPAKEKDIRESVGEKSKDRLNLEFEEGKPVGLRLDIPAYINKNIWAITIHEPGKSGNPLSYNNVARIKNVSFDSDSKIALDIARHKMLSSGNRMSKATIARMNGEWVPIEGKTSDEKGKSAMKIVQDIINDPKWVQVGMNPFRHSWFYDRADGMPVTKASEVIQIGGLVYAKDVTKVSPYDKSFEFIDKETGKVKRFQESEDYSDMKDIVKDMIDEGMSASEIKKLIGTELGTDQVSLAERAYNELTMVKEEVVATNDVEAFRDKVKDIPESGKVSKYLSGDTIERVEGEAPRNIQEIDVMPLVEVGMHGKETVAMAKEVYGDKYIEKTLEFLDTANLKAHEKALLYVSLENEMFDLVKDNPSLKKLQDLVRAKSQQFLRESSLAINMGRLRAIMKDGFNYESITDGFLSTDQLIGKKEVEKAIQSDANAIQKEYEGMISESNIEQLILSGVEKQINEIYKKLPTARKVKADKAIAALERIQKKLKGKAYDATIGLPIALIDSGITVIKNSIKAGVNIADAIELGINHIKEKYGKDWANEGMFRDDMTQGFKSEGVSEKEMKAKELSNKDIVNQALIEAGFGKEITVKKEKRKVLDWKKLAGEEGSVDKLRENVEKIIGKEAAKELEDEYNNLRASIIEKSLNELERRNIPRKKVNLKTSAKKLAEIYNYGLFEKESDTYDHLMNTVLGMGDLSQKNFNEAKKLARSLAELFSKKDKDGNPISQESLKHGERTINKKIERLLSGISLIEGNGFYLATVVAKEFIGASQRNALVSVGQAIDNVKSGYTSRIYNKIGFAIDNVDTKSLMKSRNKLARMTFKDITLGGGIEFGDVTSPFITKSITMDAIENASDSRLYHALASSFLGKPFLEAADSMHKSALTAKFFQYNLIKILRKKGYSKTEAKNYVSEQLTGQSFEDALVKSKEIIDEINKSAGKKVIPDSEESIYRFANDLVNESLIQGEKINIDEIKAALKAAETVAGYELGHEPNNIISKPLNLFNSWVQVKKDKAVKDKKWNDAASLNLASLLSQNILNPYVGGGMNWTFLGIQLTGIPTFSTINWNIKARSNKLDLSTEQGMKNLEETLKYQLLAKNANTRMIIGSAISLAAFALAKSTGADDDIYEWLKKNAWAKKYFAKVSPRVIQFVLAKEDKKMSEFFGKQVGMKIDAFDEGKKIKQAIDNISSGKTQKALGGAGQLAGSRLSTPIIPWRMVRDVSDIYRGLNGLPAIKHEYKASGFASGYFQGGMVEQLGLRPENVEDETIGRESSGNRSESGSRESSGTRTQSGTRE